MRRYEHTTSSLSFLLLLFFFFLVQLVVSELPSNQSTTMDKLHQLLNTTQSPSPWNPIKDTNPCSWKGVTCNPNGSSITQISLPYLSISTSDFLSNLCQIDSLETIDLSNNHFTSIPDWFVTSCGKLSGLKNLTLSRNKLSGALPDLRGHFTKLEFLDLSHNSLDQTIGLQLDGLTGLKRLNLGYNQFTGPVPTHYGKAMMVLQELQLPANKFSGEIPPGIANYLNLYLVDFGANQLSGSIPDRFRELPNLQTLVLSANNLSGEIPQFLSSIPTLSRFSANQNRFSGAIPPGITSYLKSIDLSYNKLNGQIPGDLLSQPNLETVDLSYNLLHGPIPANLSSRLVRLRLGSNYLNGTIPTSVLGDLQNLTYLELDNNTLIGSIPPELGLCNSLQLLNLAMNKLSGALPAQLGALSNLHELKLQVNNLVGAIPDKITQLKVLEKLNISCNSLSGALPPSISKLQSLTNLDSRENKLNGSIPASVSGLSKLIELQLGKNRLGGDIPPFPQSLQTALNLSSNLFTGHIPETLSNLRGLEVLDLSNNRFFGKIPEFLATRGTLTLLVLANNSLSGDIPDFPKYVTVDTTGNKDLVKKTGTETFPPTRTKKAQVSVGVIVAVAVSALAMGIIVVVISLSISRRLHRINSQRIGSQEESAEPSKVIQEANLLTANSFHRSNIDFPKAMEAVGSLSNIVLKTRFSTYYKAVMPSGASYFVKKLNWSDKIFQLENREKFVKELQILGKLSNSNVTTPLAYFLTVDSAYLFYEMASRGTLFDALHSSSKGGEASSLDWASRYSIAIGVAQGLAFLHGFYSGPLLLLDLTSKTIMLRSLKEPQIGEIELYKVIDPSKSTSSLSMVAGSVGYIPPEYAYTMRVTMAGNVYSFGVILLELLTGKPAVSHQGIEFAKWVVSNSAKQDKLDHILDYSVRRTSVAVRNQMLAVLKIALSCVSVSPAARPKTKSILRMLLNAR